MASVSNCNCCCSLGRAAVSGGWTIRLSGPLRGWCWLAGAEAQRVADGTDERGRAGNQVLAACWHWVLLLLQHSDNIRRRNASANPVHRDEAHSAIGRQDEYRWLGNASFFIRVVNAPFLHDATLAVGEDGERQLHLLPHRLRLLRGIHGNSHQAGPGGTNSLVVLAIFRQLAETKGSPVAAIEQEDQRTTGRELRQPAWRAGRVRELKIRHSLTDLGQCPPAWRRRSLHRHLLWIPGRQGRIQVLCLQSPYFALSSNSAARLMASVRICNCCCIAVRSFWSMASFTPGITTAAYPVYSPGA
jgi:hypothetical protein